MGTEPVGNAIRNSGVLPESAWSRSSRCAAHGSCVEVAQLPGGMVGVRDGKVGAASPVLSFSPAQWRAFTGQIAAGRFAFPR
jgi:hypothetical protein